MRYQITEWGWSIGQFLIPASTIINLDKPDSELTQWEQFAKDRTPPLNVIALDWDCAEVMWRKYPEFRHRLKRQLAPYHEEIFGKLLSGELNVLTREQVQLAQSDHPERIARDRAEQLRREQLAAEFKRELQEQLNSKALERNMKGNGNG